MQTGNLSWNLVNCCTALQKDGFKHLNWPSVHSRSLVLVPFDMPYTSHSSKVSSFCYCMCIWFPKVFGCRKLECVDFCAELFAWLCLMTIYEGGIAELGVAWVHSWVGLGWVVKSQLSEGWVWVMLSFDKWDFFWCKLVARRVRFLLPYCWLVSCLLTHHVQDTKHRLSHYLVFIRPVPVIKYLFNCQVLIITSMGWVGAKNGSKSDPCPMLEYRWLCCSPKAFIIAGLLPQLHALRTTYNWAVLTGHRLVTDAQTDTGPLRIPC